MATREDFKIGCRVRVNGRYPERSLGRREGTVTDLWPEGTEHPIEVCLDGDTCGGNLFRPEELDVLPAVTP